MIGGIPYNFNEELLLLSFNYAVFIYQFDSCKQDLAWIVVAGVQILVGLERTLYVSLNLWAADLAGGAFGHLA